MRRYETFVIIDPDISQDQRNPLIERVEELITQMDGFLAFTDDWGERKLAYEIRKKGRGYYVRFDYCALPALVDEIERFFRIDDRALKYMTVLLDKEADLEKIKEERAAAEKALADKSAAEGQSELESPPEETQAEETAPESEEAKTDEEVPASETEEDAAEITPSATKEEA
jgi:small subunit ribosomal protein S6